MGATARKAKYLSGALHRNQKANPGRCGLNHRLVPACPIPVGHIASLFQTHFLRQDLRFDLLAEAIGPGGTLLQIVH
ncbi:hypothetical protein [Comamonas terrae]|uniref:Uncharacterized protein n=1 Tax=Comamonas terrae TaxID=673548 RepID=A0ABW5UKL3_9BURK|nr:hypothetical protein [Comamonas terrae]